MTESLSLFPSLLVAPHILSVYSQGGCSAVVYIFLRFANGFPRLGFVFLLFTLLYRIFISRVKIAKGGPRVQNRKSFGEVKTATLSSFFILATFWWLLVVCVFVMGCDLVALVVD